MTAMYVTTKARASIGMLIAVVFGLSLWVSAQNIP
jgi:hypothetical protein